MQARARSGRDAQGAKGRKLHPREEKINRIIVMVRAKVEHPFRVLKRQFGSVKTRYRARTKNRAQFFTLFALGGRFLVRRRMLGHDPQIPRTESGNQR